MVALRRVAFVLCLVGAASGAYVDRAGKHGEASLQSQLAGGDEADVVKLTEAAWALGNILGKASGDFPDLGDPVKDAAAALARSITESVRKAVRGLTIAVLKSDHVEAVSPLAAISKKFPDVGGEAQKVVLALARALSNACKEIKAEGPVPRPWADVQEQAAGALNDILDAPGNAHGLGEAGAAAVTALTEVLTTHDGIDEPANVHGEAALALGKVLAKASGGSLDQGGAGRAVDALKEQLLHGYYTEQAAWALGESLGQGSGHAFVPVEAVKRAVAALTTSSRPYCEARENAAEALGKILGKASGDITDLGDAAKVVAGLAEALRAGPGIGHFEMEKAAWAVGEILGKASGVFPGLGDAVAEAVAALTDVSIISKDRFVDAEGRALAFSSIVKSKNSAVKGAAAETLRNISVAKRAVAAFTLHLESAAEAAAEALVDIFQEASPNFFSLDDAVETALRRLLRAGKKEGASVKGRESVNRALGEILRKVSGDSSQVKKAIGFLKHNAVNSRKENVRVSAVSALHRAGRE